MKVQANDSHTKNAFRHASPNGANHWFPHLPSDSIPHWIEDRGVSAMKMEHSQKTKRWFGSILKLAYEGKYLTREMVQAQVNGYMKCDDLTKDEKDFLAALQKDLQN